MKIESKPIEFQPFKLEITFEEMEEVEKFFALFDNQAAIVALDYSATSGSILKQLRTRCMKVNPFHYKKELQTVMFEVSQ